MPFAGAEPGFERWWIVMGVSLVGAVIDLASRRIPNWLTLPAFFAGLVWSYRAAGWAGLGAGLGAAVLMAFPYVVLFVFAGGGAGDAKLMAAVGAWLGLLEGAVALGCVAAAGVVLALGYAAAQKRTGVVLRNVADLTTGWASGLMMKKGVAPVPATVRAGMTTMPYGVAICAGVCAAAGGFKLWRG